MSLQVLLDRHHQRAFIIPLAETGQKPVVAWDRSRQSKKDEPQNRIVPAKYAQDCDLSLGRGDITPTKSSMRLANSCQAKNLESDDS
jgi:hypothetical protein